MLLTIDRACSIEEPHDMVLWIIWADITYCDHRNIAKTVMPYPGWFTEDNGCELGDRHLMLFSHPKDRYRNFVLLPCL